MAFQAGVLEGSVTVDGLAVPYYDSGGSPGQRSVFLLHGTGGSAVNNFWALYPMLAMRHRVIAIDFVDPRRGELTVEHFVQQAVSVIDELSPQRSPVVVGYSLGAVVAAKLAANRPELAESLVLVAGWVKTDVQQQLRNDLWTSLYQLDDANLLASFMVLLGYSPRFLRVKSAEELSDLVAKTAAGPDRRVKMTLNRSVDISAAIARIACPTLVVGCTEDQMAPIWHSELLFGGISDARFASINSGHAVVHERPAELFTLIDNFICSPEKTPAGAVVGGDHA